MNNLDRKALEEKEKQLRKELNQASDEFESQVVKTIGIALVSGVISYGLHKLLSPKGKSKVKKASLKKDSQSMSGDSGKPKDSNSSGTLARIANAVIPIIVSNVGSEILNNIDED